MKPNFKALLFALLPLWLAACAPQPTQQVPEEYKKGQDLFHRVCSNCHGSDGKGGYTQAPNLIHRKFLPPDFTDEDIRDTIVNGSISKKMPSQRSSFNDAEIAEIVKYLRYSQQAAGLKPEVEADAEEEEEDDVEEEQDSEGQEKAKDA